MNIYGKIFGFYGQVSKILKSGNFSDKAVEKVTDKVIKFANMLEKQLEKAGLLSKQQDDTPISLYASTSGDAIGTNTSADSKLDAAIVDYDNVSIAMASATSVAVASGGVEVASTASFTNVTGSDFTFTKVYNKSGPNWQKSTEVLFSVDFKFLEDLNLEFGREYNKVTKKYVTLKDGNVAKVQFDAKAVAEDTAVDVVADALAIEDTISSSYIEAGIYIS